MQATFAATPAAAHKGVEEFLQKYIALWSRHAIAEHSQLLTEDADLVTVLGSRYHGRAAIQELHEHLHRTIFSQAVTRMTDSSVRFLSDDVALCHVHWEMAGAAKVPGWNIPEPRTGIMTLVCVERDGKWLVRAMHNTDTLPTPELPG